MGLRHREFPIEGVQFHPSRSSPTPATISCATSSRSARAERRVTTDGRCARPRVTSARPSSRSDASASPSSSSGAHRPDAQPREHHRRAVARNDPAYAAWRWRVSSASGPRVAQSAGDRAAVARGCARGAHHRAEVHEREQPVAAAQAGAAIATAAASASAVVEARAAHAFAHAPDVHLDTDHVGVVDLRGDRGGGVATDAGKLAAGRRASLRSRSGTPLPTASGPGAGSRAGPTPRSPSAGPRGGGRGRSVGNCSTNASNTVRDAWRLRLVQHHFRHEHDPAVARRAPRQIVPAVSARTNASERARRACLRRVTALSGGRARVGTVVVGGVWCVCTRRRSARPCSAASTSTPPIGFCVEHLAVVALLGDVGWNTTDDWRFLSRSSLSSRRRPTVRSTVGTVICVAPVETNILIVAPARDVDGVPYGGSVRDHVARRHDVARLGLHLGGTRPACVQRARGRRLRAGSRRWGL